jgi:hypothetical protein
MRTMESADAEMDHAHRHGATVISWTLDAGGHMDETGSGESRHSL